MISGVEDRNTMKVSTLAYWRVFMLVKMAPRKAQATGMKARTFGHSSASTFAMPSCPTENITNALTASWQKSTNPGAGTWCTVTLLTMSIRLEQLA